MYYLDAYGLPTTQATAVGSVTAAIGIDESNEALLNTPRPDEARIEKFLDGRLRSLREVLATSQDAEQRKALLSQIQLLQDKLDFLHERLRSGGLKEQYYPRTTISGVPHPWDSATTQYVSTATPLYVHSMRDGLTRGRHGCFAEGTHHAVKSSQ